MRIGSVAILLVAPGCVLALDDRFTVEEPVTALELRLGTGDVLIESTTSGVVTVEASLVGASSGDYGHTVVDGVLQLDYDCGGGAGVCGGDVFVSAPSGVHLDLVVGSGAVDVHQMAGDLLVDLGAGAVTAELVARPGTAAVLVGTGEIDLTVPAGAYQLDVDAATGTIDVSGITDDPEADASLVAITGAGAITIRGE